MSLKSSPGGQSFNFNTMGWPSLSCSRSAFTERHISCISSILQRETGDKHSGMHINQSIQTTNKNNLGKTVWALTGDDLEAVPEVSHLYIRDNSTVSTVDQVYILVSKLLTEGIGPPQMTFQAFMYPWHQHRLDTKEKRLDWWQSNRSHVLPTAIFCSIMFLPQMPLGGILCYAILWFLLVPASSTLWRSSSCCRCWDPVGRGVAHHRARSVRYVVPKH